MPRNKSTRGRGQSGHQAENNPGDLKSIESAVDWLCHVVDGLDRKLDTLTTAQDASGKASEPSSFSTVAPQTAKSPLPGPILGVEYYASADDPPPPI